VVERGLAGAELQPVRGQPDISRIVVT